MDDARASNIRSERDSLLIARKEMRKHADL